MSDGFEIGVYERSGGKVQDHVNALVPNGKTSMYNQWQHTLQFRLGEGVPGRSLSKILRAPFFEFLEMFLIEYIVPASKRSTNHYVL